MKAIVPAPSTTRYSTFARYAHWLTFALVLLAYVTINARKFLERGSAERIFVVESHYLLGMLVLFQAREWHLDHPHSLQGRSPGAAGRALGSSRFRL